MLGDFLEEAWHFNWPDCGSQKAGNDLGIFNVEMKESNTAFIDFLPLVVYPCPLL